MATPIEALSGVVNVQQVLPNLVTGGQPTAAHFEALREAGLELVLDIRDPMEPRSFDQPSLLQQLGIEYLNVTVASGTLTDETIDQIRDALRTAADKSVLVHCQSGNRVGGVLIPYLVLDHGFSEEDATMAAMGMGLRSVELLEWGQGYARRHSAP